MKKQSWLESLRKWIDGEEDLNEQGEPRQRSKWDDFLVAVAREVEESMHREMFTPPGGPTYIPREYIVFLNPEDDAEWQGEKREGLQRGLHYVLSERAREMGGTNEFQTRTLTVDLRVDPGLERNKFRVQHVWDTETQKTMVNPRKRESPPSPNDTVSSSSSNPPGTSSSSASEELTLVKPRSDEATIVRPRKSGPPVFKVAITRGSDTSASEPDVRAFYKDEITIGRGSKQLEVDLKLEGDMEVSRKHATLRRSGEGQFELTCHGANPITVRDQEISSNQSCAVTPGDKIGICSYQLEVG